MQTNQVEEMQGLYGPFTLTERVVQKIWLRQDFATAGLLTVSGKSLVVKDPGRWNLQEGPDFKEARLLIDGVEVIGDVEVHFNVSDWHSHQHELDRNFDRVVLHLVLHPERRNPNPVVTSKGHFPECLYLMPLLNRDLESVAMDEALLELEQQDELEWVARFIERPFEQRLRILDERATGRWSQKLKYAQQRLDAEGWEGACHSYALEVFGYARNRAPMLRLAAKYPLAEWSTVAVSTEERFAEEAEYWKLNGLRPANHPRRRLAQYIDMVRQQPHWPDRLAECLKAFPRVDESLSTAAFRKTVGLPQLRRQLSESIFSEVLADTRLNTLVVDAILPLASAAGLIDGQSYWMHWSPGDSPDALRRFLKHADVTNRQNPQSNGWNQGALALFVERGG
ncbi:MULTISPECIES: DUF2851 family protein [unclassified Lentimonas]|uniref:DUF2851 family protein n=1 Tax=unclassified Lentimonas TaxID=2630993 RepID=UPI00132B7062|nr:MULTISPECIES: DUF2851 family protein [unclassified Lentimonas]CAA6677096.1 Unannotated [Lentimonas sp. CC4]CAA6686282.1 Unannotated [Lentimonas sp. CC6]CAA7074310.1 Unannotated [Lentimonas sp. CC4]CAA7171141.1 Unannotated [Lentimonas sp. CC21]CAA7180097.1 Unannotated [Lentimonas sp. CC8]